MHSNTAEYRIAVKARATLADRTDPGAERRKLSASASIQAWAKGLCASMSQCAAAEHPERVPARPTLFINKKLGRRRVAEVTCPDISELHQAYAHIPYQANRTLGVLSKMFNLAEVWGLRPDGSNPCRHVRKYREVKHERYLSAKELARLGTALDRAMRRQPDGKGKYVEAPESPYVVAAFKLLILTGCRLGEIQSLNGTMSRIARPQIHSSGATVVPRTKNGRPGWDGHSSK